jgi:mono/diheme cytochrome c family protein
MRWLMVVGCLVACLHSVQAQEVKRADLKPGLVFTSTDTSGFTVTRLEPAVGLTLNKGEAAHPSSDGGATFTWTGYQQIVTAGKYTFEATLAGEVSYKLDGKELLGGTARGEAKTLTGNEVELKPGIYPVEVKLYRLDHAVRFQLRWVGPRFRNEPIPSVFFGHLPKQRPASFDADLKKEHGRFLFEELACIKCHTAGEAEPLAKGLAERTGPNLSKIAERAYPGWLDAWLKDPKKLRPHTSMAQMFKDDEIGEAQRHAVVAYLATLGKPITPPTQPLLNSNDTRRSLERGANLYLTVGCAACHGDQITAPPTKKKKDDEEIEEVFDAKSSTYGLGTTTGPQAYYTLNHVGSKTRPEALAKFLQNPLETNPHGRMPRMLLTSEQALDIARHLCRQTDDTIRTKMPEFKPTFDLTGLVPNKEAEAIKKLPEAQRTVAVGKSLFVSKGCINCHVVDGVEMPQVKKTANSKLHTVPAFPNKGCLSEKPEDRIGSLGSVNYGFTKEQRESLVEFVSAGFKQKGSASPVHTARVALKRFNCLNCHQREKEGGIDLLLADKMKANETAENADDVQPPQLTGIGSKSRTSWLNEVLLHEGRARPWMGLRMPQFGEANLGKLHEHLPLLEGNVTDDTIGKATFSKAKIEAGKNMAGKQGHGCISCHDISGQRGGGTRGPDLATTNQRVRYEWYVRWMHQPQRLAPGTKMPNAFIDGKSLLTDFFAGDGDQQLEAMWAYFSLGPGLPLPPGMEAPKGLVITVKDRPELLRTFMPDNAGTKCLAVGYPGGFNLVFDSTQGRLAYAWAGNFLDMSSVWNDRGGNPAKILGTKFFTAPQGQPWALTTTSAIPDFDKQAKNPAYGAKVPDGTTYPGPFAVSFKGYQLAETGEPTFRYEVTPLESKTTLKVSESAKSAITTVANGLTRQFTLDCPQGAVVWLNVGTSKTEPKVIDAEGNPVKVEGKTSVAGVRVLAERIGIDVFRADAGEWVFNKTGDGWEVLLKVHDGAAAKQLPLLVTEHSLPKADPELLKELK